jgi:nicotinamidase-related amidase
LPNENIIDKPGRSAFQHTDFGLMLSIKGIKNLIICGATTDVCVTTTMRDANDNNFDCLLVEDATAASEVELHKAAVEMVKTEGGIFGAVSSTDNILAALGEAKADAPFVRFNLDSEPLFKPSITMPSEDKEIGSR